MTLFKRRLGRLDLPQREPLVQIQTQRVGYKTVEAKVLAFSIRARHLALQRRVCVVHALARLHQEYRHSLVFGVVQ